MLAFVFVVDIIQCCYLVFAVSVVVVIEVIAALLKGWWLKIEESNICILLR